MNGTIEQITPGLEIFNPPPRYIDYRLDVECIYPPPTEGGMYLHATENTTESDGSQAMDAVWVFDCHGQLLFMPMGDHQGRPLGAFPYLSDHKWSLRLRVTK